MARDRFLAIEPLATPEVDADPDQLRTLFWDGALHNAVVCTQGQTIGRLLTELAAKALVVEDPLAAHRRRRA